MKDKIEGVAIVTYDAEQRRLTTTVVNVADSSQAIAMVEALQSVANVQATPVKRDFDVFGKMFWVSAREYNAKYV